jgi:hypothetical protein
MNIRRLSLLVVVATLAACGGSGGGGGATEDALVAALEKSQVDSGDELGVIGVGASEYRCMAKGILADADRASAVEAGIAAGKTGDDLLDSIDPADASGMEAEMMSLLLDCLAEDQLVELLVTTFAGGAEVSDEVADCLRTGFTDMGKSRLSEAFLDALTQNESSAAFAELTTVFTDCTTG